MNNSIRPASKHPTTSGADELHAMAKTSREAVCRAPCRRSIIDVNECAVRAPDEGQPIAPRAAFAPCCGNAARGAAINRVGASQWAVPSREAAASAGDCVS